MSKMIIRNVANAIKGGNLTVITGENLKDAKAVFTNLKNGSVAEVAPVNGTEHTLTCRVPDGKYTAYTVKAVRNGEESNELSVNIPTVKWIYGDVLFAGGELRVFGQGFVDIDRYIERQGNEIHGYGEMLTESGCRVTLTDRAGIAHDVPVLAASNYQIRAAIPALAEGEYTLTIDAGCGVASVGQAVTVKQPKAWPDTVFNVRDFGARPIPIRDIWYKEFSDATEGFQKALDAAEKNGGGIVFVPNGRYCFKGSLRIPRYTRLVGEDVKRTWLELPKGMKGETGWGSEEEGKKIQVFLGGYGDFTVENFNICGVYSPILIGAPVKDGEIKYGTDKFNRVPNYCNLIDQTKDADNVTVKNCYVIQEPTYMTHHKDRKDTFFIDEDPTGPLPNANIAAITNLWTTIAIKGRGTKIIGNQVQGGGTAVALMGAQNVEITGNILYCGDLANCIGMFSTSYNPDDNWKRPCTNVIIENNQLELATKLNRGTMWIMQDHCRYYIAGNHIKPFFWHSDAEGFCFHIWGDHLVTRCTEGKRQSNTITVDMKKLVDDYGDNWRDHRTADGRFVPGSLKGGNVAIVGGTGMGQLFHIIDNSEDTVTLDGALDCDLDETSRVNVSDSEKFFDTLIIDNEVDDLGRGVYQWGASWGCVMDGNLCVRNSGCLMEDLSNRAGRGFNWTFAGEYFNQIINNRLVMPRGFSANFGIIGVKGGENEATTVSMIIRGNVSEDDSILSAQPNETAPNGLNYEGVVMENNLSLNCQTGILVHPNVSVTLKDNEFRNVENQVEGAGKYAVIL